MAEWCCIFPQSVFREASIEWRDDQMFDSRTLINGIANALISLHERVVKEQLPKLGLGSKLDDKATDALVHILRPEIEGKMNVSDLVELAEIEVGQLEAEQLDALGMIMANKRVVVTGGAGSGKTVLGYLACERFLNENTSARAAFVCCSSHLAQDIRRKADRSNFGSRLQVYSLHDLTRYFWERLVASPVRHKSIGVCAFAREGWLESWSLGANLSFESPSETYLKLLDMERNGLAERAAINFKTLYSKSPICSRKLVLDGNQFDFVVIDEAQDFADSWWDPILAALRDPDAGGVYLYSDEGQRVFDRKGTPPVPLVPLILEHNIRNTRQIATAFGPLVDHPMRSLGGDGPEVRFVACTLDDALTVGDDQIEALLDDGWRPEDVALLTTGTRHPEQKNRQAEGNAAYWDSFWDAEQVFYGHVLGFKGLERRAVVLVVNDKKVMERSSERLYVGLSRARDQLVVCGDPALIAECGGPDVARRLGIGD